MRFVLSCIIRELSRKKCGLNETKTLINKPSKPTIKLI